MHRIAKRSVTRTATRTLDWVVPTLFAAVLTVLLAASAAQSKTLTTDEFSIWIPDGWREVPKAEVTKQIDVMRQNLMEGPPEGRSLVKDVPEYEYAFTPSSTAAPLDSPYIMLDTATDLTTIDTDETVLNAEFKTDLITALSMVTGKAPVLLYESDGNYTSPYGLEFKVINPTTGAGEIHAFTVVYTEKGYVLAYWFADAEDYGVYVDKLRKAAMSLAVAEAAQRK